MHSELMRLTNLEGKNLRSRFNGASKHFYKNLRKADRIVKWKNEVGVNFDLSISHPYYKHLLSLDDSEMRLGDKVSHLEYFKMVNNHARDVDDIFMVEPRDIWQYAPIETAYDFRDTFERLERADSDNRRNNSLYKALGYELIKKLRALDASEDPQWWDVSQLSIPQVSHYFWDFYDQRFRDDLIKEKRKLINKQLMILIFWIKA